MLPVLNIVTTWTVFLIFQSQIICIRGDCGPPPEIKYTLPLSETSGVLGTTIDYRCNRSAGYYEIPGQSRTITCQDDDTWSSASDFCARACGVPDRLSYASPKASDLAKDFYPNGTKVSYDCKQGYKRAPRSENSIICLDNYTWSIPSEFCERRSCGHPGEIENGDFDAPDFLFGTRVTYKCNAGYRLSSKRNYQDCSADGTWTNVVPQCEVVVCPAPERPVDGTYSPEKDEYTYLDAVNFKCSNGLHVFGETTTSCTSDGTWSESSPICRAVNCQDPGQVQNGRKTSGFVGPYTLHSSVKYECETNFMLNGSSSITCNIDSQWEPEMPKCLTVTCQTPNVDNSRLRSGMKSVYVSDDSVEFECNKDFVLSGLSKITCNSRGQWEPSPPKCDAVTCQTPKVDNSRLRSDMKSVYVPDDSVEFECNKDFVLSGSSKITCNSRGQWEPSPPKCDASETGLSSGVIAGIIIIGCLVIAVISAILIYCCLKKKSGKPKSETPNVHYTACNDA